MAYTKTNWVDDVTPLDSINLNNIEEGIVNAEKPDDMADMRILFASDIHHDSNIILGATKEERIAFFIKTINEENRVRNVDILFICGDITSTTSTDMTVELKWWDELVDKYFPQLEMPYYLIKGNHDTVSDARWAEVFDYPTNYTVILGQYAFICVDAYGGGWDGTAQGDYHTPVDTVWMQGELNKVKDKTVFIVEHYTDPTLDPNMLNFINYNDNVICAFNGHTHVERRELLPGGYNKYQYEVGNWVGFGAEVPPRGWCYSNVEVRAGQMIFETIYPARIYSTFTQVYTVKNNYPLIDGIITTGTKMMSMKERSNHLLRSFKATSGSWTPDFKGTTTHGTSVYAAGQLFGNWMRVGKMIHFNFRFDLTSFSGGAGYYAIGGLPFPNKFGTTNRYSYILAPNEIAGAGQIWSISGTDITIRNPSGSGQLAAAAIAVTTYIQGSGIYETD